MPLAKPAASVSFQGTGASCARETDPQEANAPNCMGRVSRSLAKARHDQAAAGLRGLSGQEGCNLASQTSQGTRSSGSVGSSACLRCEPSPQALRWSERVRKPTHPHAGNQTATGEPPHPPQSGRRAWAQRAAVGRTGRSSRWGHVHPRRVGKPHTRRRARASVVQYQSTYGGTRPHA